MKFCLSDIGRHLNSIWAFYTGGSDSSRLKCWFRRMHRVSTARVALYGGAILPVPLSQVYNLRAPIEVSELLNFHVTCIFKLLNAAENVCLYLPPFHFPNNII